VHEVDQEDERDNDPSLKNLPFDYEQFLETCFQPDYTMTSYRTRYAHGEQPEMQVPDANEEGHHSNVKSKAKLSQNRKDRQVRRDRIMQALFWRLSRYRNGFLFLYFIEKGD
jgi:hypothetical protein